MCEGGACNEGGGGEGAAADVPGVFVVEGFGCAGGVWGHVRVFLRGLHVF